MIARHHHPRHSLKNSHHDPHICLREPARQARVASATCRYWWHAPVHWPLICACRMMLEERMVTPIEINQPFGSFIHPRREPDEKSGTRYYPTCAKVFKGRLCQKQDAVSSVNLQCATGAFFYRRSTSPQEVLSVKTDITVTVRTIIPSTKYVFWNPFYDHTGGRQGREVLPQVVWKTENQLNKRSLTVRLSNTPVMYLNAPTSKNGTSKA